MAEKIFVVDDEPDVVEFLTTLIVFLIISFRCPLPVAIITASAIMLAVRVDIICVPIPTMREITSPFII